MIRVLSPHLTLTDFVSFIRIFSNKDNEFELKLNSTFDANHSITYSSARSGLYHILKSHSIVNKKIVISAYTCCVVTEAIVKSGNTPLFVDCSPQSFNAAINKDLIASHTDEIGAIVVTNMFGIRNFDCITSLKISDNVLLILDCALSPSDVPHRPKEALDYTIISCNVRKPFTCLGGGVVFTDNKDHIEKLRNYTNKKRQKMPIMNKIGRFICTALFYIAFRRYIYSLTMWIKRRTPFLRSFFNEKDNDIFKDDESYFHDMCSFQKRVGISQLAKFKDLTRHRTYISNIYYDKLVNHYEWIKHYWKKNTPYSHVPFLHPKRDELEIYLLNHKMDTAKYFDYSIPSIKQYRVSETYANTEKIAQQIINLPVNTDMGSNEVDSIVRLILSFDKFTNHENKSYDYL